jgi:hypothetical protein
MDRQLIEQYAAGADVPGRAIRGLAAADLDATPVPGTWTIRQIVVHLLDSDLIGSERMKRVIAMDGPDLLGYDETLFASRLHYHTADVEQVCALFRLNRLLTADLLRRLPDATFRRTGNHSEHGVLSLADFVADYTNHLEHHLKFIRQKRVLLGKPLD